MNEKEIQMLGDFRIIPENIEIQEKLLLGKKLKLLKLDNDLKNKSNAIMTDIFNATEEGKPKYSNAEKRSIEHEKRLFINKEYNDLKQEREKLDFEIKTLEIEIKRLYNNLTVIKHTIIFLASKREEGG